MRIRSYLADSLRPGRTTVRGDEAHHLARVRRAEVGDRLELFDGAGNAYPAVILELGKDRVELDVLDEPIADRVPELQLTLATAVPKGDRFDWLVEKATELGVVRLIPIITARSVVDPRSTKLDRLRRTVLEACKQCGRNRLMEIEPATSWSEIATDAPDTLRIIAQPGGESSSAMIRPGISRVRLAIGPEGGFSEAEIEAAIALGGGR